MRIHHALQVVAAVLLAAAVGATFALVKARRIEATEPTHVSPTQISSDDASAPTQQNPIPLEGQLRPPAPPTSAPQFDLAASLEEVSQISSTTLGIVITPLGSGGSSVRLGDWSSVGSAWSTIKVPLAIAALRHHTSNSDVVAAAITQSDNAAAEQLWADLGEPAAAAAYVEDVLSGTGDPTEVQSQRVRPEFSAFGQTLWPLTEQANFLSAAACDSRNTPVLDLMGRITAGQRWGLGILPGAQFKGGWGPSPGGAYLVRQFGVVDTPNGRAAIALAATPTSGSFQDGTAALTAAADWLAAHGNELPGGECA